MATLNINEHIGGYWVKALIKSNAYTETYRVEDANSHPYFLKLFLIKNLPSQLLDKESKEVKEINYSSHLDQRNIVSFINKGSVKREEGDLQYYVTNYFNGVVLSDYVSRNGQLPEERAEKIFREILAGMKYLHCQKPVLLHNDIDPSNIMPSSLIWGIFRKGAQDSCTSTHQTLTSSIEQTRPFPEYMTNKQTSSLLAVCCISC